MQNDAATIIKKRLATALETLKIEFTSSITLGHPADANHGDYASSLAMEAFSTLSDKSAYNSPRALAEAITGQLQNSNQLATVVSSIEVAGPGFINFKLSEAFLHTALEEILRTEHLDQLTQENSYTGKKVVIEFTDPNPFKELHIGHLYSNSVGEAISRLLEAHGAKVKRVCYQGDVGMHVAKSVWGMKQLLNSGAGQVGQQGKGASADLSQALSDMEKQDLDQRVNFLGKSYAKGATAFEVNEIAAEEIKQINFMTFKAGQETLVEQGWEPQFNYDQLIVDSDLSYPEVKLLYQTGRAWSLKYFDQMYQRMGMSFDDFFFESVVGEYGLKIVREYLEKGVFKESQGAVIFPGSEHGLHDRVFINSMGLPTYEAKELGLAPEKYRRDPYDFSIIITGNEIDEYFKVLLKALSLTNPDLAEKTSHLSHGMVRLPEGKMSSRTGKVLTAQWLLDQAKTEALGKIKPDGEIDRESLSEIVGLGAIKYAFLKSSIGNDIAFSFEESLSFQGKSGPYLQYSFVRCASVWEKASQQYWESMPNSDITKPFDTLLNNKVYINHQTSDLEVDILRNLYRYFESLDAAATNNAPHILCSYLHELAQSFNSFYGEHTIVSSEEMKDHDHSVECKDGVCELVVEGEDGTTAFRLMLTQAVARVLHHGLNILGIKTVNRM